MSDTSLLYQDAIKQFAQAAHGHGQLAAATGEAKLNNPLCGDRIRIQVAVTAQRVTAIAHETKGCLLCRAAASAIGARAVGLAESDLRAVADDLERSLQAGTVTAGLWPELSMFDPVHGYPARHGCVMLPFRTLLAAVQNSSSKEINRVQR